MKFFPFITLYIVVFCALTLNLQAQYDGYSSLKLRIEGARALKSMNYPKAVKIYEALHKTKQGNSNIGFKLAGLYQKTRQYEEAMELYKKLYEMDPGRNVLALYSYGQMAMATGKYRIAKRSFTRFDDEFEPGKKKNYLSRLAGNYIEGINAIFDTVGCANGNDLLQMGPTNVLGNHIVQLAYDPFGIKSQLKDVEINDIEKTYLNDNPGQMPPGYISGDKTRYYFSTCYLTNRNKLRCAIYSMARDSSGHWGKPVQLPGPVNVDKYLNLYPTVGTDVRRGDPVLYFVSNRPGGKGGLDIWYSRYDKRRNAFREPKNAGSKINTAEDEISPYYDNASRILYFSTNGLPGYGAFDVYSTTGEQRSWTEAKNLGATINSSVDDYFYHMAHETGPFMLASNRNTWQGSEYSTDQYFEYRPQSDVLLFVNIDFTLIDAKDNIEKLAIGFDSLEIEKMETGLVDVFLIEGNTDLVLIKSDTINLSLPYTFEADKGQSYAVDVIQYSDTSHVHVQLTKAGNDTVVAKSLELPVKYNIRLQKNIHYGLNQSRLTKAHKYILDSTVLNVAKMFPNYAISICSYTDKTGTRAHNKKLSERRAKYVYNYLIANGIDKNNIAYEGYGESNPLEPEKFADGSINQKGRMVNRRTEIVISVVK